MPAAGGPSNGEFTIEEREQDREARLILTRELGHERGSIVGVYLGRG